MYNFHMPSKRTDKFIIPTGAPIYATYLPDYESDPDFAPLRKMFNENRFSVSKIGIPYRVINHWDEIGLLANSFRENERGWRKFTLVEMAWITLIKHLRSFGFPLEKVRKVKSSIMKSTGKSYGRFELYLVAALFTTTDPYVGVLPDGTAALTSPMEMELFRSVQEPDDILIIPLRRILKEIGVSVPDIDPDSFADEKGSALKRSIFEEGNKAVTIKIHNNEIAELEATKVVISENPRLQDIKKHIQEGHLFGDIVTHIADGKAQSVEVKKRIRFKK